jgi:hypothetical protein
MTLALIYIFATAKPISVRRLSALFLLTLILVTPMQRIFGYGNTRPDALEVAGSLTLIVWSVPLWLVLRDTIYRGVLTLDAFRLVSAFVQWSYVLSLTAASTIMTWMIANGMRSLTVGELIRLLTSACAIALAGQIALSISLARKTWSYTTRPNWGCSERGLLTRTRGKASRSHTSHRR